MSTLLTEISVLTDDIDNLKYVLRWRDICLECILKEKT
jgi:hypothetical protein